MEVLFDLSENKKSASTKKFIDDDQKSGLLQAEEGRFA